METSKQYHKINPVLANAGHILLTKLLFPTTEYRKDILKEKSYIFAPNHTNNLDGYIIWCLLSHEFDIDVFMFKEFWNRFPKLSIILPLFNTYPITRDKLVPSELKEELRKLKDELHSLVIFPQGRHVDPKVMLNLARYHLNTIPMGAFYVAAKANKPLVPIYMEPQKAFSQNAVVYGNILNPEDYNVISNNGRLQKDNLIYFAKAWLEEVNKAYQLAPQLANRQMRDYPIHLNYTDASGSAEPLTDPNNIVKYFNELKLLSEYSSKSGITDIYTLGKIIGIPLEDIEKIDEVKRVYEQHLLRSSKVKMKTM